MKNIYFAMLVVLVVVSAVFPQRRFGRDDDMRERMAELEKIKLIEVMEMDEETTLRFFSRRAEFQKQHEKMRQELHLKIDLLEATLKSARMVTDDELQSMINEVAEINLALEKHKIEFVNSLSDVLSYDKIARYVVFERRFKEELRRLILHERKPPMREE
jgi:hypothetical protein